MNGIGVAALALALLLPADGQDRLWGYSGAWEIRQNAPVCTMRFRAKDAAETELVFEQRHTRNIQFKASGLGWQYPGDWRDPMALEADGTVIAYVSGSGNDSGGRNGFSVSIGPELLPRLFASRHVRVRAQYHAGADPLIAMPPSMTAQADFKACLDDVASREGGSGKPMVTPLAPRGTVESWTTVDDYPPFAIRGQIGGHLRIRLTVNAYGDPTACDVIESTGAPQLDAFFCKLYLRRSRFSAAALDAQGRPTRGTFDIVRDLVPPERAPLQI